MSNFCAYRECNRSIPDGRKYCSLPCSSKEKGLISKKPPITQTCKNPDCSSGFTLTYKTQVHCSRSCAAQYNNSKRIIPKFCKTCGCSIDHKGNYCDKCRYKGNISGEDYTSITIGDLRARYDLHAYHAKLRGNSRSVYAKSANPLSCLICKYDKHVDICHVRAIADFTQESTVSEVNSIDNLIALCKNHHWEFDNDMLSDEDSRKLSSR